jgi:hypothetical protein
MSPIPKRAVANDSNWPGAGAAVIEVAAALQTVKLLVPMSGMKQAAPKVD